MGLLDLVVWIFIFFVILNELTIQEINLSSDLTLESCFHLLPSISISNLVIFEVNYFLLKGEI